MDQGELLLIKELRHTLHQHPELSNHEYWTKQTLIDFLRKYTKLEIVDKGSWFYAVYKTKNSTGNISIRADIDAIAMNETIELPYASVNPGVAHKCGHDGHAACLAGLALEVSKNGSNKNVYFLFQHAEETGEGAILCKAFIKENEIDEIYAVHNMSGMALNRVFVIDGTAHYASMGMTIKLEGIPAHASEPENGINPAYAIANIINHIPVITNPNNYKGQVKCTIIQVLVGERAFGISASHGELLLTIRALHETDLDMLKQSLADLVMNQANIHSLNTKIVYNDIFPETVNHKESVDKIRAVCEKKGLQYVEMKEPFTCSEDFGHYLKETKGAICYIGNGENYPNIHTYEYDFNDDIILTVIELFKGIIEQ